MEIIKKILLGTIIGIISTVLIFLMIMGIIFSLAVTIEFFILHFGDIGLLYGWVAYFSAWIGLGIGISIISD